MTKGDSTRSIVPAAPGYKMLWKCDLGYLHSRDVIAFVVDYDSSSHTYTALPIAALGENWLHDWLLQPDGQCCSTGVLRTYSDVATLLVAERLLPYRGLPPRKDVSP